MYKMQHTSFPILSETLNTEKVSLTTLETLFRMSALVIANLLVCMLMMAGFFFLLS